MTTIRKPTPQPGTGYRVRNVKSSVATAYTNINVTAADTVIIEPAAAPAPVPASGPSGIAVPPVKAGWRRVGFSHFDDVIPFGSWTGDKQGLFMGRASGSDTSKGGTYRLSEISQHDGMLDMRMRQLADGTRIMGCPINKAPNPSNDSATAPKSLRVILAMKVLGPVDFWKIAWMVAKYGAVRAQEIDFAEFQLKAGVNLQSFLHLEGKDFHVATPISAYQWNLLDVEVVANAYVAIGVNGKEIGRVTDPALVGEYGLHLILQNETAMNVALPLHGMGEAHTLLDFAAIEVPA